MTAHDPPSYEVWSESVTNPTPQLYRQYVWQLGYQQGKREALALADARSGEEQEKLQRLAEQILIDNPDVQKVDLEGGGSCAGARWCGRPHE